MMARGVPQVLSDPDDEDDYHNNYEPNILPFFESRHQISEYTYIRFSLIAHTLELTLTCFVIPYLFVTKRSHVPSSLIVWTLILAFRLLIFIPIEGFLIAFVPEVESQRMRKKAIYIFYMLGILCEYVIGLLYVVWCGTNMFDRVSDSRNIRYFHAWVMGIICFNLGMMVLGTVRASIGAAITNRTLIEPRVPYVQSESRLAPSHKDCSQIRNSSKYKCCICMSMFTESTSANKTVVTKCDHVFHRECIQKWIAASRRCPLCASDICE